MEIYRGDIFYVKKGGAATGSEQHSDRPAVIVSNEKCNTHAPFVEIVYLTTADKKRLPTHVEVLCRTPSTALCEQIFSVSKERLGEYIRCCTNDEMDAIDEALMISLDLDCYLDNNTNQAAAPKKAEDGEEVKKLKEELKAKQREIDGLLVKNDELYAELCKEKQQTDSTSDVIKLAIERDLYKQQYDELLEKVIAR